MKLKQIGALAIGLTLVGLTHFCTFDVCLCFRVRNVRIWCATQLSISRICLCTLSSLCVFVCIRKRMERFVAVTVTLL